MTSILLCLQDECLYSIAFKCENISVAEKVARLSMKFELPPLWVIYPPAKIKTMHDKVIHLCKDPRIV